MSKSARQYFKGQNFMTPNALRYGFKGRFAYELSEGRGLFDQPLYGVTVARRSTGNPEHDLSTCFNSLAEAETYILSLGTTP